MEAPGPAAGGLECASTFVFKWRRNLASLRPSQLYCRGLDHKEKPCR